MVKKWVPKEFQKSALKTLKERYEKKDEAADNKTAAATVRVRRSGRTEIPGLMDLSSTLDDFCHCLQINETTM